MIDLFVYGTLLCPEVWQGLCGPLPPRQPARLHGYRRGPLRGEVYPAITPAAAHVDGALYRALTTDLVAALDVYEGDMYRRAHVQVHLPDGTRVDAQVYVIADPHAADVLESEWSLDEFRRAHLPEFITALDRERAHGAIATASTIVR